MLVMTKDGFEIHFEAEEEEGGFLDDYMEPEDVKRVENRLKRGWDVLFCAKVSAVKAGIELGTDYLGQCIYKTKEEFYTKYKDDYFADMVSNAITEAKQTIKEINK